MTIGTEAISEAHRSTAEESLVRRDGLCIIGAGPAGLAVARCLADRAVPFEILERQQTIGGLWDISNESSPIYESAHFISSKSLSGFSDVPFPEDVPEYPSHRDVLALIRSFAKKHDLERRVEHGAEVTSVEPHEGRWLVRTKGRATRSYDGVVLASGFQWTPSLPVYRGMDSFTGEAFHSVRYRSARVFEGKKVLVVGCGASGIDIANDAATRAARTCLSMRRGHYFLPKHMFGLPTDVWANSGGIPLPWRVRQFLLDRLMRTLFGDLSRYGLPKPDHRILERPPVINSQIVEHLSHGRVHPKPDLDHIDGRSVTFVDGSSEVFDVIVYSTGYLECWPYVAPCHLRPTGAEDLFLHLVHRRYDDFFVAGLLRTNAGGYELLEDQGRVIADIVTRGEVGRERLRTLKTRMRESPRFGIDYAKNDYQSAYLDATAYRERLAAVRRALES